MSKAEPQKLEPWEKCAALLWRVKVPGGWLYRTTDDSTGQAVALAFVPHPVELIVSGPGCVVDHAVVSRVDAGCGCPGGDRDGFNAPLAPEDPL